VTLYPDERREPSVERQGSRGRHTAGILPPTPGHRYLTEIVVDEDCAEVVGLRLRLGEPQRGHGCPRARDADRHEPTSTRRSAALTVIWGRVWGG
jgi:hypothetical protein